eukprot:6597266-Karenia_brevis.AAC.1
MAVVASESIPQEGKKDIFSDEPWSHHKTKSMEFIAHIQDMIQQNIGIEYKHVAAFYGQIRDSL